MPKRSGFVQFNVRGLKELDKALAQLPKSMSRRVLIKALTKAAEPLIRRGRLEAPKGWTRKLMESFGVRPMRRKRYGAEVAVGPNAPHAHLVEFGTAPRVTVVSTKKVLAGGGEVFGVRVENAGVRPNRFYTRAWEATKMQVLADLRRRVWEELAAAARKLSKKADRGTLGRGDLEALG